MGRRVLIVFFFLLGSFGMTAQELGNADEFLEVYTDSFQEKFFEGLKQKGIENYDRAYSLFLECKKIQPDNPVIDYEIARVLYKAESFDAALTYGLEALGGEPDNYWYLQTFMEILKANRKPVESFQGQLAWGEQGFMTNLVKYYLSQQQWGEAEKYIALLVRNPETALLKEQLAHGKSQKKETEVVVLDRKAETSDEKDVAGFSAEIAKHLREQSSEALMKSANEALELFPAQPYFYFAKGMAHFLKDEKESALEYLGMAEDLSFETEEFHRKLYQTMKELYIALGKPEKALEYENKLKSGL